MAFIEHSAGRRAHLAGYLAGLASGGLGKRTLARPVTDPSAGPSAAPEPPADGALPIFTTPSTGTGPGSPAAHSPSDAHSGGEPSGTASPLDSGSPSESPSGKPSPSPSTSTAPPGASPSATSSAGAKALTPAAALTRLADGNARWAAGTPASPDSSGVSRDSFASPGQPVAVILSCIDMPVPPELAFDQEPGDLTVVRTGAETLDNVALASVGFGPTQQGTSLIVVLGHDNCATIDAAIKAFEIGGGKGAETQQAVVDKLRPAYEAARRQAGNRVAAMIEEQVRLTVAALGADPALASKVTAGKLNIVGGRYDSATGTVTL